LFTFGGEKIIQTPAELRQRKQICGVVENFPESEAKIVRVHFENTQ